LKPLLALLPFGEESGDNGRQRRAGQRQRL